MAYTSTCGFKHDVFISYAHADNFTLFGSVQWVTDFVKDLEVLLAKKLGTRENQSPQIWIDHELAKNIPLDNALADELKNAATYIVIMSPAYLESAWCKKERQQFLEILKQKGVSTRVFLVEIDQLERKKYPEEISANLVPYKFWTMDDDDTPRTLGIPDRKSEEYYKCLLDVAKDMANELKKIKNISENKPAVTHEIKGTVFLAQVTDDLDERREEIKRYLKDEGFKILPEENYPYEHDQFKLKMEKDLSGSLLYVQLLSSLQGKKLSGNNERISKFQFDIAKTSGKKLMIWRSSDLKTEEIQDETLRKLLESEYVRAEDIEEFKAAIKTTLQPPAAIPVIETHSENPKFIYICTDARDRDYCDSIIKNEIKQAGLGYSLPFKSNELAVTKKFQKQNFIDCYATLFVYCQSEPDAVLSQILECYKIKALRKEPFRAVAIYDGPPKASDEGTIEIQLPAFEIANLNCRENNYEFTENFLKKLSHD